MPETDDTNAPTTLAIPTQFIRHRNALFARADFGPIYVDFFLHLQEHRIAVELEHAELFKRALAVFLLHCASGPRNELIAWTLHFQQPFLNLFLTADNQTGAVTGRVYTENIRELSENLLYVDLHRPGQPQRRSAVSFNGSDPLVALEAYYAQSEQRPARAFHVSDEDYALVSEHPDCDTAWVAALTATQVATLATTEILTSIETRQYRWHCGCDQQRMLKVLAPLMRQDPEDLFQGEEVIEIRCPRCAARHHITRESLEAHIANTT